jgi:hypothetical protein
MTVVSGAERVMNIIVLKKKNQPKKKPNRADDESLNKSLTNKHIKRGREQERRAEQRKNGIECAFLVSCDGLFFYVWCCCTDVDL